MESASSAPADLVPEIKQEQSSTSSHELPEAYSTNNDIPFDTSKKYKRSEIHDKYGGK